MSTQSVGAAGSVRRLQPGLTRRLVRRERHRSRSTAVAIALVVLIVAAAYVGTESVLALLGRPALLQSPTAVIGALNKPAVWSIPAVAALVVLGILALVAALAPGRRARHRLTDDRVAVVVDDDVIAGSLSRRVATAGSVSRSHARTTVSSRRATVNVTPNSGFVIERDAVSAAAREAMAELAPIPAVRTRVVVAESGVLA